MGIIMAVELAHSRGWKNLWIESDSTVALKLLTRNSLHKRRKRGRGYARKYGTLFSITGLVGMSTCTNSP
ncbi:hypothetical protein QYF36_003343 [Acer negundo]|nr:hypothetical protein QYF36_003343 [Acer negundo]